MATTPYNNTPCLKGHDAPGTHCDTCDCNGTDCFRNAKPMHTKDGERLYMYKRLTTRAGKDMILSNDDGRWCTAMCEDDYTITVETPQIVIKKNPGMTYAGRVRTGKTEIWNLPKVVIEDCRQKN